MKAENIISSIRDIYRTNAFIPLHEPQFSGNEVSYVVDCLESTFVSTVGKYVGRVEEAISSYTNSKFCSAMVNGTSALHIALNTVGVEHNTEVLTQAISFVATANAISYTGAKPVFIDVDYSTMGLSPVALKDFLENQCFLRNGITYNRKTKRRIAACVPMHTFGFPCRIDEIAKICLNWNIPLVEDAAESIGSLFKGKHTGTFGEIGTFSFNGNKVITSGGGGAVITNREKLHNYARHISTTAKKAHPYEYYHDEIAYNYRMPNLNAALLMGQIEQLESKIEAKRKLALKYSSIFNNDEVKFRLENEDTRANYWLMCLEFSDAKRKEEFLKESNKSGIMTRPLWRLLNELPMYKSCQTDQLRNSRSLYQRIVNIPSTPII